MEWNQRPEDGGKNWGQKQIADAFGVDRSTVAKWLNASNVNDHKASKVDHRVKVTEEQKAELTRRRRSGDTQRQIAAAFETMRVQRVEPIYV